MRLIDADKYCDFLNTYPLEKVKNNFMSFYRDALQKTYEFEVEAIPVECIKKWAYQLLEDGKTTATFEILDMLEEWEKENGKAD